MNDALSIDRAGVVIERLRTLEPELRRDGIASMSLFGSMARGDATLESDIDLVVVFDPAARMDLIRWVRIERQLGEALGRRVDLLPEPIKNPYIRANVERDRRHVF